ncbi:uncharacterized protein A1O9_12705 [Exophiala aquamarina CBS 119918]|uniref:3-oxoacyl-[acyl-carrier protein] reductase n=1 Tax=Exophiala aquamarina CBS 119918 TaxID=1182545 RepID=A0A072NUZ8_9EURO|nr:uncharacterized protein A1O9_12705 [Exophiala aquamarina CBS 119918]KEF51202.1 hypothetical protein A1O9_12705 [Exophiala aquamarina CBS 119918]
MYVLKANKLIRFYRTVTGAGRGIGLSIIKCLLKDTGPDTVIFAVDVLSENLEELQKSQPRLEIVLGDVSQRSTSEKLLERIHARDCRLETLILNAGVLKPIGPIVEVDVDQFKRLFDINFFALIYTVSLLDYLWRF